MRSVPILMQFYIIAPVSFHVNTYMEILFIFYHFFLREDAAGKGARIMTKFGQVIAYNKNTGMATIRYARPEACEKCGACSTGREETIRLKTDAPVDSWVRVELPDGRFLSAAFLAYIVPLVLFLAGFFLGHYAFGTDGMTILFAFIGLAFGGVAIFFINRRIAGRPEWTPHITAVYDECPDGTQIACSGQGGF